MEVESGSLWGGCVSRNGLRREEVKKTHSSMIAVWITTVKKCDSQQTTCLQYHVWNSHRPVFFSAGKVDAHVNLLIC